MTDSVKTELCPTPKVEVPKFEAWAVAWIQDDLVWKWELFGREEPADEQVNEFARRHIPHYKFHLHLGPTCKPDLRVQEPVPALGREQALSSERMEKAIEKHVEYWNYEPLDGYIQKRMRFLRDFVRTLKEMQDA